MVKTKTTILNLFRAIFEIRRALVGRLFDPYRPELHYMRGPGPRWRDKQNAPPV